MKLPGKLLPLALVASLALNAAFLADHVRRGTFRRMFSRMDLVEAPVDKSAYQEAMEARYRKLPGLPDGVVFAGDSLIYHGPWSEFYSNIHNRGIPNETSALLLGRLGEITRGTPRRIFLLTGTNDLIQGVPIAQLVRNYRAILDKIRLDSPKSEVVMIGLLPMNPALADAARYDNPAILEANRQLESLARDFPGTRFLDLASKLADDSGKLRHEFTEDGIHLTVEGYLALRDAVGALMTEAGSDHPTTVEAR
jgi:lysophospholipase L1-like esterase